MEIFDEGRAAVSTHRQEILAERDVIRQLQEHLAETQAQVTIGTSGMTRSMSANMTWCRGIRMKTRLLKPTRCNQSFQHLSSLSQHPSPLRLCKDMSCRTLASYTDTLFCHDTASSDPAIHRCSEESPQQVSQPVIQQPSQPEPSVPSQQSLPSTHRWPGVQGVVSHDTRIHPRESTTATYDTSCMSAA